MKSKLGMYGNARLGKKTSRAANKSTDWEQRAT
jgi:hypothetical protein